MTFVQPEREVVLLVEFGELLASGPPGLHLGLDLRVERGRLLGILGVQLQQPLDLLVVALLELAQQPRVGLTPSSRQALEQRSDRRRDVFCVCVRACVRWCVSDAALTIAGWVGGWVPSSASSLKPERPFLAPFFMKAAKRVLRPRMSTKYLQFSSLPASAKSTTLSADFLGNFFDLHTHDTHDTHDTHTHTHKRLWNCWVGRCSGSE
jgi:hypothetical protein